METINYSLEDGLDIQRLVLSNDPTGTYSHAEDLHIPGEKFNPEPVNTYNLPHPHKQRRLSFWTSPGIRTTRELAVHALAWGGTADNPVTEYEGARIHEAFPEYGHAFLSMPGHGTKAPSKAWPLKVRSEMLRTGSFHKGGQYLAEQLDKIPLIKSAEATDVFGHSTGARSAISLAANLGARNLVLFDPPGTKNLGWKGLARNFLASEGAHGKQYTERSKDEEHRATMGQAPNRKSLKYIASLAVRHPLAAHDFYYGELQAMGRDTLGDDLKKAKLTNIGRVVVLSPDNSSLNNLNEMATRLHAAQQAHPGSTIEHYVVRKSTHTVTRAASTVLAQLFRAAIHPAEYATK